MGQQAGTEQLVANEQNAWWLVTVSCEILTKHSAAYRGVVRGRGLHRSNDAQLCAQCGDHLGTVLQICLNPEELGYQW